MNSLSGKVAIVTGASSGIGYATSKLFAREGAKVVVAAAAEFGSQGVRVNALLPGGTDTPMSQTYASTTDIVEYIKSLHILKHIALPEEIAQSALYLASDASSFTTSTTLIADGGASINPA